MNLKELRKSLGLNQSEMSHVLGAASFNAVLRWENGQAKCSRSVAVIVDRLRVLQKQTDGVIQPRDMRTFLLTPAPVLKNFAPCDLLKSGYAFHCLLELVEKGKSGELGR